MTKEEHQALVERSKFILIGSGETYWTEIVAGPQLLERIFAAMFGTIAEAPEDYVEDVKRELNEPDYWNTDQDGTAYHWETGVGETDHINIYRLTHEKE